MRVRLGAAASALAVLACAACNDKPVVSQAAAAGDVQGESVTAVGCPVAGPQPGCVTIKAKGVVYDISGANPPVDLAGGKGVSLTGRSAGEVTACGAKLNDIHLDYLGLQCGAPTPPPA